jgi:hypothetical protein
VKDIKFGSIALNTSLLGNGPHIFKIVATDTQDQITEKTYSFTTELPEVSFSNLISTISSDATFEALWIVPADSIRPINGYWKIDGVNVSSPEFDGNSGVDSLTLTQDQISVGSHQITYVLEFSDDDSKEINKTINIVAFAPKINVLGDLEDGPFPQGHKWKIQGQLIASGANPLPPSIKWRTKGWSKWSTIKLKNGKFSTTKAIFHNATLELYVPGVGPVPEETLTFDLGVYVSSKLTNTTRLWISPKIQKLNVSVNSSTSGRCTLTSNYQSNSASTTTTQTTSLTKGKGYFLVPTSFFNVYGPGNYIASVECAIAGLQTLSSGFSRAVW